MPLSESTRFKLYQPVVSTADFLVTFPIFSTDDLRVDVDGVTTTAFSVTATFVDGRSDDASITLTTAVSGVDVEIYGERAPRSETEYVGNSPNLAQQIQTDSEALTAVQQEQLRDFGRALKIPAGATQDPNIPASAAGNYVLVSNTDNSGYEFIPIAESGVSIDPDLFLRKTQNLADISSAASAKSNLQVSRLGATFDASVYVTSRDMDDLTEGGFHQITGSWSNGPSGASPTGYNALCEVVQAPSAVGTDVVQHFYTGTSELSVFRRVGTGSPVVWGVWRPLMAAVDQDDFSSDSDTLVPTQQSVKAYVESQKNPEELGKFTASSGVIAVTDIPQVGGGFGEYSSLFLDFDRINLSATAHLHMQFSTDNGSTWQSTSYQSVARGRDSGATDVSQQSNASSRIRATPSDVGGAFANSPICGTVNLLTPLLTSPRIWGHLIYTDSANDLVDATFSGLRGSATTHNALLLFASTGTITGGTVTLWGRK